MKEAPRSDDRVFCGGLSAYAEAPHVCLSRTDRAPTVPCPCQCPQTFEVADRQATPDSRGTRTWAPERTQNSAAGKRVCSCIPALGRVCDYVAPHETSTTTQPWTRIPTSSTHSAGDTRRRRDRDERAPREQARRIARTSVET